MRQKIILIVLISILLAGCEAKSNAVLPTSDTHASENTAGEAALVPLEKLALTQESSSSAKGISLLKPTDTLSELEKNTLLHEGYAGVRIITSEGKVIYIDP